MWFLLTLHFGHRARHEARQIKFDDIALKKDEASGEEYLEWTTERESKTRHGDENEHQRSFRPKAYETGDRKCPVSCFKEFVYRRPEAKSPESPFFLGIRHRRTPEDKIWFVNNPMGKNKIGQFLSSATKNLPMSTSGKFTNHSVRKTCIKTLLDSGVSHKNVAQLSGHKSLKVWIAMLWRPVNSNGKCRKYSVGKKTTLSPNRSQMHRRKISRLIQGAATSKDPCQQAAYFQEQALGC